MTISLTDPVTLLTDPVTDPVMKADYAVPTELDIYLDQISTNISLLRSWGSTAYIAESKYFTP